MENWQGAEREREREMSGTCRRQRRRRRRQTEREREREIPKAARRGCGAGWEKSLWNRRRRRGHWKALEASEDGRRWSWERRRRRGLRRRGWRCGRRWSPRRRSSRAASASASSRRSFPPPSPCSPPLLPTPFSGVLRWDRSIVRTECGVDSSLRVWERERERGVGFVRENDYFNFLIFWNWIV